MMGGACGPIDCNDNDAIKHPPQYMIPETNWAWWTPTICTNCAYTGACSYTDHSSFALTAPTYIEQFGIWADVNYGMPNYVFQKDGVTIATGTLINTGDCQGNWCHLKFAWNKTVMPGSYSISIDRISMCSPSPNTEGAFRGNGAPLVCVGCTDNDNDGYFAGDGNCGPVDCNDNNPAQR